MHAFVRLPIGRQDHMQVHIRVQLELGKRVLYRSTAAPHRPMQWRKPVRTTSRNPKQIIPQPVRRAEKLIPVALHHQHVVLHEHKESVTKEPR